ncbi:MAG: 2-phospho-L-lactate guanylyltransferase [Methanomicrobiales archaeon]|nr:2-phospho-L-lactate guanylyltransferase [Methanomicrobiales archaeon]
MCVRAIIPFKPVNPKTRLSCILTQEEREAFARVMLDDVVDAVSGAGCAVTLLCTHPFEHAVAATAFNEAGLNEALNACLQKRTQPVLIIMSDLPLITAESVRRLLGTASDLAIAPGRGGGTNALFIRKPQAFHVDFYGASFCDHVNIARKAGLSVDVIDSFRLHTDVDEKEDLVEILLHAPGRTRKYLADLGFSLSVEKGRVGVQRNPHKEAR